jgi:STIP1 family protein 1
MKEKVNKIKEKVHEKRDKLKQLFHAEGIYHHYSETKDEEIKRENIRRRADSFEGVRLQFSGCENENDLLLCPISQELMTDPVMTPYGHCFQRSCIEAWLMGHDTCPITGQKLSIDQLIPCYTVKAIVEEHMSKQKGVIKISQS